METARSYNVIAVEGAKPIKAWTKGVPVEDAAMQQLVNLAKMPFVFHHVAALPDVHYGIGAAVGSVFASKGAVVPAAVGVDIGCGMVAARTPLVQSDLEGKLQAMRAAIEQAVPHGRTNNGGPGDRGAWHHTPPHIMAAWEQAGLQAGLQVIQEKHPTLGARNTVNHLGTLGTGNHFIEVCVDQEKRVWVMLHSGSRGVGNRIGQYFIDWAKKAMERYFIALPDKDLAYLPEGTAGYKDYIEAMMWAQKFALLNRALMLQAVIDAMRNIIGLETLPIEETINCHHNYAQMENHFGQNVLLTCKGAVRARQGDLGIIPGSMGVRSYIVRGLGNSESFQSCSHGAGRAMSRTEAKKRYTAQDHIKATAGVECRKDEDVIDETPMAYKDVDAVMAAQADLVEVVTSLKQVICVKG